MHKTVVFGVFCPAILFSFAILQAQDETPIAADPERFQLEIDDLERPVMITIKLEKEVEPRLPNGYRSLVSDTQKEEIYKIQKDYNEIIERLKARIRHLETERNRKIEGVLAPDQVRKIRALETERQQNRGDRTIQRRSRRAVAPATTAEQPAAVSKNED